MNKDEMIKDIRAIIDDRCEAELGQVHAESKGGEVTKTVSTSLIAKDIYNANYRKVGEDEIVIKKREYEALLLEQKRLKEMVDRIPCGYELKEITRQETARKILQRLWEERNALGQLMVLETDLTKLAKEYDIELE